MQIKLYLNMLLERVDFIFRTNALSETVYLLWMKVTPFFQMQWIWRGKI